MVLAVAWLACERPEDVRVDFQRASLQIGPNMRAAVQLPEVRTAVNGLFSGLGTDPAVAAAATHLGEQLRRDRALSASLSAVTAGAARSPRMAHIYTALLKEAHGRNVGQVANEKVQARWNQPEVTTIMRAEENELLQNALAATPELDELASLLVPDLDALFTDKQRLRAWGRRLTALDGNRPPAAAKATELYVQTAWAPARIAALVAGLANNAALRQELASTLAAVLALDSVSDELRRTVAELAADPELRSGAETLMLDMLEPTLDLPRCKRSSAPCGATRTWTAASDSSCAG